MMFRNSIRLLFSNFATVWKILVYKLFAFFTAFALSTIFAMPLLNVLNNNIFFENIKQEFSNAGLNFNIYYLLNSIYSVMSDFINIVSSNIDTVLTSLILVIVTIIIFGSFLSGLSELAVAESLNGYMSSNANYPFMSAFVRTFKKSVKLQLSKLFINLPINILIAFLVYLSFPLINSTNEVIVMFAPFIIITLATFLSALNLTVFSGVTPAMVIHDCDTLKAYQLGFRAVGRRFFRTLSTSFIVVLTILTINIFFMSLTGGVSFIITLPSSIFLLAIFPMVMYYGSMGMRYYVDPETILSPKKLEEQDNIHKAKFIL